MRLLSVRCKSLHLAYERFKLLKDIVMFCPVGPFVSVVRPGLISALDKIGPPVIIPDACIRVIGVHNLSH